MNFVIWQKENGKRTLTKAYIKSLDRQKIVLSLASLTNNSKINEKLALYCHGPYRTIGFKEVIRNTSAKDIELPIPKRMALHENRAYPRYKFIEKENDLVDLIVTQPNTHKKIKSSFHILNLSQSGMAIIASTKQLKLFKLGTKFKIGPMTHFKVPSHLTGKVVYCRSVQKKRKVQRQTFWRIGIQFSTILDPITDIEKGSTAKNDHIEIMNLSSDEDYTKLLKIPKGTYIGPTLEGQNKILKQLMACDKVLAARLKENLDYLEIIKHLTKSEKMLLLSQFSNNETASALRNCTKDIIFYFLIDLNPSLVKNILKYLKDPVPAKTMMAWQTQFCDAIRSIKAST